MKSEVKNHTLKDLADAYLRRELRVNPEYQRGTVWSLPQKQALIDSLLRGYQLPLFYVHLKETPNTFTKGVNTSVALVDGQQRLAAIASYLRNEFGLPDPGKEPPGSVVPSLLVGQPAWHGKRFEELAIADQERLHACQLQVVEMREESQNEVRDLFIRLQAGTPLTAQEKRDAWPGDFTRFVIRHAGKPAHPDSNPKAFFRLVKRGKNVSVDDGDHYVDGLAETRKFFAGLAMTLIVRRRTGEDFVDLKGKTINEFYRENLDLPDTDPAAMGVRQTLDAVAALPGFESQLVSKPVSFQMAFHFALLVDAMNSGDYVPIWRDDIADAFLKFQADVAAARLRYKESGESLPHHKHFVVLLGGSGSDTAEVIRRRHAFFAEKMHSAMRVKLRDPQRLYGALEKEVIWNRDKAQCKACGTRVPFGDATIHHIVEHTVGGTTTLDNGILICEVCHRDRAEMQRRASEFQDYIRKLSAQTLAEDDEPQDEAEGEATSSGKLKVMIHWRQLGVNRDDQTIFENQASSSIVKLLFEMIVAFGEPLKQQFTVKPIVRYPLSRVPATAFVTSAGRRLNSLPIPGTDLHFCPHSDNPQKVRQLKRLFSGLVLPNGQEFPQDSVEVSMVDPLPGAELLE